MQSLKSEAPSQQYEIPATRRQDGSWRKARRVRPGFVPQEEVPLYTPKGKRIAAQANSSSHPPGWHPDFVAPTQTKCNKQHNKSVLPPAPSASSASKKETSQPTVRIISKKEVAEVAKKPAASIEEVTDSLQNSLKIREDVLEISKRLKRLRRRYRELEVLEEKINAGEIANPQKDQLEKIQRRVDFMKEIEELEKVREDLKSQGLKHPDADEEES